MRFRFPLSRWDVSLENASEVPWAWLCLRALHPLQKSSNLCLPCSARALQGLKIIEVSCRGYCVCVHNHLHIFEYIYSSHICLLLHNIWLHDVAINVMEAGVAGEVAVDRSTKTVPRCRHRYQLAHAAHDWAAAKRRQLSVGGGKLGSRKTRWHKSAYFDGAASFCVIRSSLLCYSLLIISVSYWRLTIFWLSF